jgi:integrase
MLGWLSGFGPVARVGVEGTGSYGAGLARFLRGAGVEIVEVDRPNRLLGLRIFEATGANIADLGEEHGHRVLRVCGKGTKVVLIPLPPAVGRAIDRAVGTRTGGPILLNSRGTRMDRHAATRRLRTWPTPPECGSPGPTRTCSVTRSLSVLPWQPEAR